MMLTFATLFLPLFAQGAEDSVTCAVNNIPDSKSDRYVLLHGEHSAALLSLHKNQRGQLKEAVEAKELTCVNAKSDFRIVNCIRRAPSDSKRVADASLTLIKHTYVSAGPVLDSGEENKDVVSESFKLYFRDDRDGNREISKSFSLDQCRAATSEELDWAKGLLEKK